MKKTYTFALLLLLLVSCSEGEYGYHDSVPPYYRYEHSTPPARTLTGKLIFDYTFDAFIRIPELLTEAFKLDECLSAEPSDSAAFFKRYFFDCEVTSSDGVWKISRQERITIIDTGRKRLSDPSAEWSIGCNTDGLYITRGNCRITYADENRVNMRIKNGRFNELFDGSADFTVEAIYDELSTERPYLFDISGAGELCGIINPRFHIGYSTDKLRQNGKFFNGVMNIDSAEADATPDNVKAVLSGGDRVAITYKGNRDHYFYTPYGLRTFPMP